MKYIGLLALAVASICAVPAAAEQWSKTYNISGAPDLRIETSDANIHVETWEQKSIEATIISSHYSFGPGGLTVEEHQTGDAVEINLRFPRHFLTVNGDNHRVDINIHMPRTGRVNLHTGDGNIDLANFNGEMQLSSGDGHEVLHAVDGKLYASTGDGHITADGRFDVVNLKTGDGHLSVHAATGSAMADEWSLKTGDGNVSLEVPENLAADLYLHTGDGHIEVNVPMTTEGRFKGNDVHGKLNGGGPKLVLRSSGGDIRLQR